MQTFILDSMSTELAAVNSKTKRFINQARKSYDVFIVLVSISGLGLLILMVNEMFVVFAIRRRSRHEIGGWT